MNSNYVEEINDNFTPLTINEEVSRCLLCHDAPCSKACPAKTNPAKFIRSLRFKNYKGAAEVVRENNALGGICARVCPAEKYCEGACSRCGIDKPIKIAQIQKYITDFEELTNMKILKKAEIKIDKSIAIIGSGPAGLVLASQLLQLGYNVDIYEKEDKLGGYLRYGIPEYRLPNKIVDQEISKIIDLGLNVYTNTNVGTDITEEVLRLTHDVVVYAVGLSKGKVLDMFKDNQYVETAVDMLKRIKNNRGQIKNIKKALIIGGGDVAMDIATSLSKTGCENVVVAAYEEFKEFKASKKELAIARDNNISIYDGYVPKNVKGNIVTFKHRFLDSEITIQTDKIILAIGQEVLSDNLNVPFNNNKLSDKSMKVSDGVYAVGDITVTSEGTVVDAVRSAKELACIINEYLGGNENA